MPALLTEQLGVAAGAAHWDIGRFRLWESTDPDILLYVANDVRLARDATGRRLASVTRRIGGTGGTGGTGAPGAEVLGGAARLTVFGPGPTDGAERLSFETEWTRVVAADRPAGSPPPRFAPLPVRDVALLADLDPAQASVPDGGAGGDTLAVELTAAGAVAWSRALEDEHAVPGAVRLSYSYLRYLPPATAVVTLHGDAVYARLVALLPGPRPGAAVGTAEQIDRAWETLVREKAIEVALTGSAASALVRSRDDLVAQTYRHLFDVLFSPVPDAGRALYALRWTRAADAVDLPLTLTVGGWTWAAEMLHASVAELLAVLDESYLSTTYEAVSVPVTVAVDPCELVEATVVSLDLGESRPPVTRRFDGGGGRWETVVTTDRPQDVSAGYRAQVDFRLPDWPPVTVTGRAPETPPGPVAVVVSPQRWLRRCSVVLVVVGDDGVPVPSGPLPDGDALTVTTTWTEAGFDHPVRSVSRIDPLTPVEVVVPVPPGAPPGRLTLSVLGVVDGAMVRTDPWEIPAADLAAGRPVALVLQGGRLRVLDPDATDPVSRRVRAAGGAPVVAHDAPALPEDDQDLDVDLDVALLPQPTAVSCWAAALAMVVSARDQVSLSAQTVAEQAGMDVDTGYAWGSIQGAVAAWGLVEEGPRSSPPAEWANLLLEWGPIWVVEVGAPYHAVVVSGISGDGTPDGTWFRVHNPWPPNVGAVEWKTFTEFDAEFGLGAGSGAAMVHR